MESGEQDYIFQLPYVAGPLMKFEGFCRGDIEPFFILSRFMGIKDQKVIQQIFSLVSTKKS